MGGKVMVNDIPMSVIYHGMSGPRFSKLLALYDEAGDKAMLELFKQNKSVFDLGEDEWEQLVDDQFSRICARHAKKSEWNNTPNNRIKKIIRTNKKKVSAK